ncbi:hypothetical protein MBLNU230_g3112t1 [Neophaeotheca triangularis]
MSSSEEQAVENVFKQNFAKLYYSGEHSDLKVICGPYHFRVHKAVLCCQSDFFKAACKDGRFIEGSTGVINLKAIDSGDQAQVDDVSNSELDDPEVVLCMMYFFYHHQNYETPKANLGGSANPIPNILEYDGGTKFENGDIPAIMHAKVFAMAVKYQVHDLYKFSIRRFRQEFELLAQYDTKPGALVAETLRVVYSFTPREIGELRIACVQTLNLFDSKLMDHKAIDDFVQEKHELCYDLLNDSSRRLVMDGFDISANGEDAQMNSILL